MAAPFEPKELTFLAISGKVIPEIVFFIREDDIMLLSDKIMSRQSEVRERLAELAGIQDLDESQSEEMAGLDGEYHTNERRYRAALISEDESRAKAGQVHDGAERREWSQCIEGFEIGQVVMNLAEGRALHGQTAEVVSELRNRGGYRGCPVPILALESRAGTTSSDVGSSTRTMAIIDRLFPDSMAAAMGGSLRTISTGAVEYPVSTSEVSAEWATTEGGDVAGGTAYSTSERTLKPDHTLGVQVKVTRRALLSLDGLEDAIRRDMRGAIQKSLDKVIFLGSGSSGQPAGIVAKATGYGIHVETIAASVTYADFRSEFAAFIAASAASGPGDIRIMIRPEVWTDLDDSSFDAGSGVTEFDRLSQKAGRVLMSGNALSLTSGSPDTSKALLSTTAGGVEPFTVGIWDGVDMIRDPFTDAKSGGLRITGLVNADVTALRSDQLRVMKGLQTGA